MIFLYVPSKASIFLEAIQSSPVATALGELTTDEVNKIVAVATGIFGPWKSGILRCWPINIYIYIYVSVYIIIYIYI